MAQGFINFQGDGDAGKDNLELLHKIYEVESKMVSGPRSGVIPFRCWSIPYMARETGLDPDDIRRLAERLVVDRQMMKVPAAREGATLHTMVDQIDHGEEFRYISRVAEMVRTIGAIHHFRPIKEAQDENYCPPEEDEEEDEDEGEEESGEAIEYDLRPQLIEGVKWVPELVESASRSIPKADVLESMRNKLREARLHNIKTRPGWGATEVPKQVALDSLELVLAGLDRAFSPRLLLSDFQHDAIISSLLQSWLPAHDQSAVVISAGTGSGKTLGFVIPALVDAVIDNWAMMQADRGRRRWSQLLLYPRVDLAVDQWNNMKGIVRSIRNVAESRDDDFHGVSIKALVPTFQADTASYLKWTKEGGIKRTDSIFPHIKRHYYGEGGRASQIIIAGLESFRGRMFNESVSKAIRGSLHRVVLDEIHLSEGMTGAHHAGLMRRLRSMASQELKFIGCSATIARPKRHVAKIWLSDDQKAEDVELIQPRTESGDAEPFIIRNHILLTNRRSIDRIGSLYDLTSLVGHQRREPDSFTRRSEPRVNMAKWQKTLGFADSLNIVGRWQQEMTKNETTRGMYRIDDPNEAFDLPYSHWFSTPLSRFGTPGKKVCESCQKGCKGPRMKIREPELRKLRIRTQGEDEKAVARFSMDALRMMISERELEGQEIEVGPLDGCPYLHAGTCWWFSPREAETEERPRDSPRHSVKQALRVMQHTANTRGPPTEEDGDQGANRIFKHDSASAYTDPNRHSFPSIAPIIYDVVVATPTLEVGVDMDGVTDVVTHKAIRNVSSYRQKGGRAGREPLSDVTVSTLISRRPGDFLHYRSPYRLIHKELVEPVPLAIENRAVKRAHAYMAVFDWLTMEECDIDVVAPSDSASGDPLSVRIERAVSLMQDRITSLRRHIRDSSGLSADEVNRAIEMADTHLRLFLKEVNTQFGTMTVAEWAVKKHREMGSIGDVDAGGAPSGRSERRVSSAMKSINDNYEILKHEAGLILPSSVIELIDIITRLLDAASEALFSEARDKLQRAIDDWGDVVDEDYSIEIDAVSGSLGSLGGFLDSLERAGTPRHVELARDIKNLLSPKQTKYLRTIFQKCRTLQTDPPYTMQEAFFVNPNEHRVEIEEEYFNQTAKSFTSSNKGPQMESMGIALRDYLPGGWTYRNGGIAKHVRTGPIEDAHESINLSGERHNQLGSSPDVKVERVLPDMAKVPRWARGPIPESERVTLVRPTKVYITKETGARRQDPRRARDTTKISKNPVGFVFDRDITGNEAEADYSMIPNCWAVGWTYCDDTEFLTGSKGDEVLQFVPVGNDPSLGRPALRHPLASRLFRSIGFDRNIRIEHIATALDRGTLARLGFRFQNGWAAFSDGYLTDSMAFRISDYAIDRVIDRSNSWRDFPFTDGLLEAWGLFIDDHEVLNDASIFERKDFIDCQLRAVWEKLGRFPANLGEFVDTVCDEELPIHGSIMAKADSKKSIADYEQTLLKHQRSFEDNEPEMTTEWIRDWMLQTFLNTLGGVMVEAGAQFAGVETTKLGYTYDTEQSTVLIYDKDAEGNGTVEMIREYLHIPETARFAQQNFNGERVPTEDFMTVLERFMSLCSEHIIHSCSITKTEHSSDIPEDWKEEAERLRQFSHEEWTSEGIETIREAALRSRIVEFGSTETDDPSRRDKQTQAFRLCSSGCPICVGTSNIVPYHARDALTQRDVLDLVLDLTSAEGYASLDGDATSLDEIWGAPDQAITYEYDHPGGRGFSLHDVHVNIPSVLSIQGTREEPDSFRILVRTKEEMQG